MFNDYQHVIVQGGATPLSIKPFERRAYPLVWSELQLLIEFFVVVQRLQSHEGHQVLRPTAQPQTDGRRNKNSPFRPSPSSPIRPRLSSPRGRGGEAPSPKQGLGGVVQTDRRSSTSISKTTPNSSGGIFSSYGTDSQKDRET